MLKNKGINLSALSVLVPLIFQLLYVRYVSYEVDKKIFADFVILSTFIYGFSQVFLSIPGQAFSRFYNATKDKLYFINEFRTYLLGINLLSIVVVFGFYFLYKDRFDLSIYIAIYFILALFNNYSLNQQIFLMSLERGRHLVLKIFEAAAKYIFPLLVYYHFQTLQSFVGGILLGYAISSIFLFYYLRDKPFKIELNFQNQKKYFLFAYPIMIAAIASWTIAFSDRYFIDYYLSKEELAIYAILAQLSGFAQVLGAVYGTYVNPIILKSYEENHTIGLRLLKKYLWNFLFILLLITLLVFALPRSLFVIFIEEAVISNQYYYHTFIILVIGIALSVFQTAISIYFVLLKKLKIHAIIFLLASAVNLSLNFLIPEYGIIMAAISTFSAYFLINLLTFWYIRS
jgi:O-antigen/teichoic acid export membrane protein